MPHRLPFAVLALALIFAALSDRAMADWRKVLPPAALAEIAGEVHILDIRNPAGRVSYATGHIAGAISAPYAIFRGQRDNPGEALSDARLTKVLRALGVTRERPTVVVYQGRNPSDFGAAARVYWTLKSAGLTKIAILDGGMEAWARAGLPLTTTPTRPTPSAIEASLSDEWLATRDEVAAISEGRAAGRLIDARPEVFLKGGKKHPAAKAAGTLKGATRFTHDEWFTGTRPIIGDGGGILGRFRKPDGEGPIVSFCNTGHWAATNWFMMSEVQGIEGVKLYPESMVGWTRAGGAVVTE